MRGALGRLGFVSRSPSGGSRAICDFEDRLAGFFAAALGIKRLARFALSALLLAVFARAAETIPPAPRDHFNDYAGLVRRDTAQQLNAELAQFERDTSNQIVVAIFARMESASSVEDYTVRVAQKWAAGQRDRKNGAVLFVFQQTRDVRIQVGYGLEGALPDALCKQIIENEIVPRFRAGDFDGGLSAGVRAMMAAARGEYRGSGRLVAQASDSSGGGSWVGLVVFLVMLVLIMRANSRRGAYYGPRGRRGIWLGGPPWGGGGGSGWSGGGGGGTFSGGGGSFGGGGAGGRW